MKENEFVDKFRDYLDEFASACLPKPYLKYEGTGYGQTCVIKPTAPPHTITTVSGKVKWVIPCFDKNAGEEKYFKCSAMLAEKLWKAAFESKEVYLNSEFLIQRNNRGTFKNVLYQVFLLPNEEDLPSQKDIEEIEKILETPAMKETLARLNGKVRTDCHCGQTKPAIINGSIICINCKLGIIIK